MLPFPLLLSVEPLSTPHLQVPVYTCPAGSCVLLAAATCGTTGCVTTFMRFCSPQTRSRAQPSKASQNDHLTMARLTPHPPSTQYTTSSPKVKPRPSWSSSLFSCLCMSLLRRLRSRALISESNEIASAALIGCARPVMAGRLVEAGASTSVTLQYLQSPEILQLPSRPAEEFYLQNSRFHGR